MCTCIYVYNAFNALEVHEESGRVGRRGGEQGEGGETGSAVLMLDGSWLMLMVMVQGFWLGGLTQEKTPPDPICENRGVVQNQVR